MLSATNPPTSMDQTRCFQTRFFVRLLIVRKNRDRLRPDELLFGSTLADVAMPPTNLLNSPLKFGLLPCLSLLSLDGKQKKFKLLEMPKGYRLPDPGGIVGN